MTLPEVVSGFTVIQVAYANSTHVLYARAHVSKPQDADVYPEGRTLFVVNLPVDATDREISLFFRYCGVVERVVYDRDSTGRDDEVDMEGQAESSSSRSSSPAPTPSAAPSAEPESQGQPKKKRHRTAKKKESENAPPSIIPLPCPTPAIRTLRKTGGIAHVVFLDASSRDKALASVPPFSSSPSTSSTTKTTTKPRPWPSSEEPRGLAHYAASYDAQRPPLDVVKAHADSWMARFEYDEKKNRRTAGAEAYRKGEAIVDEDGFTLVTRGGAYGKTLGGGVGVASKRFEKTMTGQTGSSSWGKKRKKEPKEKETFYAFQKAEKQRQALLDLRKNFEADKARIEKLKESRRFKPY